MFVQSWPALLIAVWKKCRRSQSHDSPRLFLRSSIGRQTLPIWNADNNPPSALLLGGHDRHDVVLVLPRSHAMRRLNDGVSSRHWISAPDGCSYVYRQLNKFRRQLEQAVVNDHGEIGELHACLIQSAARHEGRAILLNRWLREDGSLALRERRSTLAEISAATHPNTGLRQRVDTSSTNSSDA